ncbi:alpha/beta hydrolase [Williamsia deligens]|uniref:Alpha/beta hydrolase n=1 Tax=Williamsia deligens TaxID=321325 RepID=A0ABW3GFI9_9NOCA|nr:alpha/beta hydrolase-fold protein [Williamsia deligens]MCP2196111.1 diacylglycerol O-acyltransferase / trehalose O-mycolyltransferase [Williamsia deligens]
MGNNHGRHRADITTDDSTQASTTSSSKRRARMLLATSGVTAAAVAFGVAGPALAVNPTQLRDGCKWASTSDESRAIQTCTYYSNALGRDVNIQIRASDQEAGGTEQGVYFLDGIGATNERNTWANPDVGEVEAFSKGVNLVLPAGGAGEWGTDWQGDKVQNGVTTKGPQWDKFLGEELPDYLKTNFDVQKNNNAIVGVSMTGGPAIIAALNNPTVFAVARSFSGFYQTDNAGGYQAIPYIQSTYTGITNGGTGMWGTPGQPGNTWAANDVSKRIAEAKANGQTIIISVGNGVPPLKTVLALAASQGIAGIITLPVTIATGVAIEMGSLVSTMILNAQAVAQGIPVRFHYNFGSHDFYSWSQTAPQDAAEIEAALKAAQAKTNAAAAAGISGPSSTANAANTTLATQVSLVQAADGTSSVTVPSKVAIGSASATQQETAASSTGTSATGSTATGTTSTGTTPPATETSTPPSTSTTTGGSITSTAPSTSSAPSTTTPSSSTGSSAGSSTPESSSPSTSTATEPTSTDTTSTGTPSTGTTAKDTTTGGSATTAPVTKADAAA